MPDKDPMTFGLLTYLWVIILAGWGGAVSFLRRVSSGDSRPHNFMEFIGEMVTSAFAGVITFYLCQASEINGLWTAVMVAISGHMGTRALYMLEAIAQKKLGIGPDQDKFP